MYFWPLSVSGASKSGKNKYQIPKINRSNFIQNVKDQIMTKRTSDLFIIKKSQLVTKKEQLYFLWKRVGLDDLISNATELGRVLTKEV